MDFMPLVDFNLVAEHGGVGRASRVSGRPKASLSRRVAELEESLGVRLFERGARALRLTEEGRALFERTAPLFTEITQVVEDVRSGTRHPRGVLRISSPVLFSHLAMGRLAAGFSAAYPEVNLQVTVEDRAIDLVEEGYDAVIRVNPSPDELLVGKRFVSDEQLVVAAPSIVRPADDDANRNVPAVVFEAAPAAHEWRMVDTLEAAALLPQPVLRLGTLTMMRDAVLAGAGAAVLPRSLVGRDLTQGRLVAWGRLSSQPAEIWVLYNSRRLLSSKVSAFVAYLAAAFPNGSFDDLDRGK
jgi:DNA-binding transcriptional LysR family regulator